MINVEQFVKKQIAFWKASEQLEKNRQKTGYSETDRIPFGPYVLFSREKGAGGRAVARLVGEKLGWHVFDREIVDEIAQKTKVRRQLIESLDEQARGTIENLIATMLDKKNIDETRFQYQLRHVMMALGQRGRVIIIGRGGNLILPGQFGLSVRLIAPLKTRVQRIAAEEKIALKKAQDEVKLSDRNRTKFIRHNFDHDITDPLLHDLIINTDAMSMNAVAEIILAAVKQKFGAIKTK
jgi:cytidylate kinase